MTTSNIVPPCHGPVVVKDKTTRPNGSIAKINIDVSRILFSTLSDYTIFFAGLDVADTVVPQIATKTTNDHTKIKNYTSQELKQLQELIKQTDHYKALCIVENTTTTAEESSIKDAQDTTTAQETCTVVVDIITPIANVILDNKDLVLNKEQVQIIDDYYISLLKTRYDTFLNTPIMMGDKRKNIVINNPFSNIIHTLFAAAKQGKESKKPVEELKEKKQSVLSFLKEIIRKNSPVSNDQNDTSIEVKTSVYQHILGTITIVHPFGNKHVVLKFVSNRRRLMHQIEGDVIFDSVEEADIDKSIPSIKIEHPSYVAQKLK